MGETILAVILGILAFMCLRVIVLRWAHRTLERADREAAYQARLRRAQPRPTVAQQAEEKDAALDSLARRWGADR